MRASGIVRRLFRSSVPFCSIADYIVTAAISALSAFQYLGFSNPEIFAAVAILGIGALNYFGPKHTGGLAVAVSVPTAIVILGLGLFCLPHLGEAWHNLEPLSGGFLQNWKGFVGIVLALSGVEAVANATNVMKLDPGSTDEHPSVAKTSTPAIAIVMLEVCILTALLGLGMLALHGLRVHDGDVDAPGNPGVRDYMLRYMAHVFVGGSFGPIAGQIAAWIVTGVIAFLLLSAVNTAIGALIAISFLMSTGPRVAAAVRETQSVWGSERGPHRCHGNSGNSGPRSQRCLRSC